MTIAIIDGDVLCYKACKPRWEKKVRRVDDTTFVELDDAGKRIPLEYTQEEDTEYLEQCWETFKIELQKLVDSLYCDDFLMAVKGTGNFRNTIYAEYKLNRNTDEAKQNIFVPTLRKLAVMEGYAVESTGREADDLLRIWAEEAKQSEQDYVICSIDKDLLCIPGRHWLMHKEMFVEIDQETALRHYYEQLLKGDPTDNIPGIPKIGPVKAQKILIDCKTEFEFQERVIEQYLSFYGEEKWKDYLLSNAKMIYLQKHKDDYFTFRSWPLIQELS